ncbi:hypothetical protein [Streptomyces roseoverticillatus]|uniref:Uncharacterized protein n=1 Tax=Streptomyces roseoverticillatus TaxID=66429 RepID=A0ABV3J523_9ACTN
MRDQRTSSTRRAARFSRLPVTVALGVSALLAVAGPAAAANEAKAPPDLPNLQAALDTLKSTATRDAVCRFFSAPVPDGSGAAVTIPAKADPCEGLPAFTIKDPVALNEIAPGFAAGTAQPTLTDAVKLAYAVAGVISSGGRTATVMLAPTGTTGWHLAAVRVGDADATYAGKGDVTTTVFSEPQIHGFYQLKLTGVEPLNDAARQGLNGQASVSLADYQKLAKARYADKQPCSEYDAKGFSSGFGTSRTPSSPSSTALITGGSGTALALAGGAIGLRRRKRAQSG